MDKSEMSGSFGAPPPGAPQETTTIGSERPTAGQIAEARANEVELKPFNPNDGKLMTIEQQASFLGKTIPEIIGMRAAAGIPTTDAVTPTPPNPAPSPPANPPAGVVLDTRGKPITSSVMPVPPRPVRSSLRQVHKPPTVVLGEPIEQQAPPQTLAEAIGQKVDEAQPVIPPPDPTKHLPAASNTDSPSRGIPTITPEKRITGGFGDTGEAQYYPLDGSELRALVNALMDGIHARIEDDLRFNLAVTYPRCTARVVVEIEAYGQDQTMTVEKVMIPPHERTPMEVARLYGDQIVFCVVAERAEMTEDGQSLAPPNQTREELQLPIPRKTAVDTPGGRMIVDVRG